MTKQKKQESTQMQNHDGLTYLKRHEKQFIVLVVLLATVRLFLFNAAFPFFNNVDEGHHFDTVVKYSRGYYPKIGNDSFDRESASALILYGSPEYFYTADKFPTRRIPPPLWRLIPMFPPGNFEQAVAKEVLNVNNEAFSPPVYYAAAGIWYDIGKWLGMSTGFALYWIRFMNILVIAVLLLLTNKFCKIIAPENYSLRYSVLLLLAFFPQDAFYSITNDVVSPLLFLLALIFLWQILTLEKNVLFYFLTGLIVAATILVKVSNIVLLGVLILILAKKYIEVRRTKKMKEGLLRGGLCVAGAIGPVFLWMMLNSLYLGDPMGTAIKVNRLGWTLKPFFQWFDHPLFSLKGFWYFITELMRTFWRGEFDWGLQRIESTFTDNLYVIVTVCFFVASLLGIILRKKSTWSSNRFDYWVLFLSVAGSVLMLAVLSLMYDFGQCWYPSRENPYFTSGRLILCMLVPFLILFVDGLQSLLNLIRSRINAVWITLALVIIFTISEVSISIPAFASQYNFFHLF